MYSGRVEVFPLHMKAKLMSNIVIKRRYIMYCAQHVSGITFTSYGHKQKIGKLNDFKVFLGNKNRKGINMITKSDQEHK
jgi:hypothetical protein